MFRTEIDGSVKGIVYEMYRRIAGIPSSGQNIPVIKRKFSYARKILNVLSSHRQELSLVVKYPSLQD